MKKSAILCLLCFLVAPSLARGQVSGNVAYSKSRVKVQAEQNERNRRDLKSVELPPTATTSFVECSVLMNVKADEYVAVFGITHEGTTLAECAAKMDVTVKAFSADLTSLGIGNEDFFVDFVAQNKTFGFESKGDVLHEKLVGFEFKKNVSIRYKDPSLLEKINLAAAGSQIFDLIKVDYIVKDINRVTDRLTDEASQIAKHKISRYERFLGIKLQPPAQVYAEKSAIYYPTQMYDSYTAAESEAVSGGYESRRNVVRHARKSTTFFFNGLDADGFDTVINPVIVEPVVQFTLYLKLKYEVEQIKAK